MSNGLYVDDIRELPTWYEGWDVARSYDEAIELLINNKYDHVSLDHDIASWNEDGREMTGYDIAMWLAERHYHDKYVPRYVCCHSSNPPGKANIEAVIARYLPNTQDVL